MAISKKQQIRGVRILLTVFYGFLLSSILFRYLLRGLIATIKGPVSVQNISFLVIGVIILISIGLAIYATWFDFTIIMLVSGGVLIFVFILTLVFGILRILQLASTGSFRNDAKPSDSESETGTNSYEVAEAVTGLIIELISILFAILGTFVLFRYVKNKYASVPTSEPSGAGTSAAKA